MELYNRLKLEGLAEAWCSCKVIHHEIDSPRKTVGKYVTYGQSVNTFRGLDAKAPYIETFTLTLSAIVQLLRKPGKSVTVLLGCLFLVAAKTSSAALGFLVGLR